MYYLHERNDLPLNRCIVLFVIRRIKCRRTVPCGVSLGAVHYYSTGLGPGITSCIEINSDNLFESEK